MRNVKKENEYKKVLLAQPRGTTSVDESLEGKESIQISAFSLNSGDVLSVTIYGDNKTDLFKVSLVDSNGNGRTVTASNGKVNHEFKITKTDTAPDILLKYVTSNK